MSPVALSLEELIPSNHLNSHIYAIAIRTALVISSLLVGLVIPFFGKPFPSLCIIHLQVHPLLHEYSELSVVEHPNANSATLLSDLAAFDLSSFLVLGLVMSLIGSLLTMLIVSHAFRSL